MNICIGVRVHIRSIPGKAPALTLCVASCEFNVVCYLIYDFSYETQISTNILYTYVLLVECWYEKECMFVVAVDDYVFFNEIMDWNVILFYLLIINTIFSLLALVFSGINTTWPRWHGYFWNHNFRFHSSMRETNQLPGYNSAVSQMHRHQLWPWRAVDCSPIWASVHSPS